MQSHRVLQTRFSGYGKRMSSSFLIGGLTVLGICGAMALVVHVQEILAETDTKAPEPVMTKYVEPVHKKKKVEVNLAPERMITVSSGPAFVLFEPPVPAKDAPKFVEAPEVQEPTPDLLVFEDSEFENPFEEEAKPVKTAPKVKTIAKTIVKKSGPSQEELERRERLRRASLAKKIAQHASVLSRSTPSYPKSARRKGMQGMVVVTVTVGTSGKVSSCQISKSSGHSLLDQSAVSAARRYRFRPAKNGLGQAVSVRKAIPFNFQLAG